VPNIDLLEDAAIRRRLRACSLADQDLFVLVAADHRQNLIKRLDPDLPDDAKSEILRRLKVDLARDVAPAGTGFLTDPIYGFEPCLESAEVDPDLSIIVALEKTGYVGESWDRMPDLVDDFDAVEALRRGATAAKLLVYFHPDGSNADDKVALIREVAAQCRATGLPLFLEPLVYSPVPEVTLEPGTDEFEDAVVGTASVLSQTQPAVLKVQFPGGGIDSRARWSNACARLADACTVPWVLLGAGVSYSDFLEQVEAACKAGASGVLVGRTIWGESLTMGPEERQDFLTTTGVERVKGIEKIVREHGCAWTASASSQAQ